MNAQEQTFLDECLLKLLMYAKLHLALKIVLTLSNKFMKFLQYNLKLLYKHLSINCMSVILATGDQITNHPLNTSTAKQTFSFARSNRFIKPKNQNCLRFCYDLPTTKSKRSCSFGYGTKYDFAKLSPTTHNPPPNAYDVKSIFEQRKNKGFSIRSRTPIPQSRSRDIPGPGTYNLNSTLTNISFSLSGRTLNPMEFSTRKFVPGPGYYPVKEGINDKGKYVTSKFKNSGATLIKDGKRFVDYNKQAEKIPGPGKYDIPGIQPRGNYFLSKFQSSVCRTFSKSPKLTLDESSIDLPGPGSYIVPSEFGIYVAANSQAALSVKNGRSNSSHMARRIMRPSTGTQDLSHPQLGTRLKTDPNFSTLDVVRRETTPFLDSDKLNSTIM